MSHARGQELDELIEAASNGELTSASCARLESILQADGAARRAYIQAMSLDADLWIESAASHAPPPQGEAACEVAGAGLALPFLGAERRRGIPRRLAAAAVVLAVLASAVGLLVISGRGLGLRGGERAACLARTAAARWSSGTEPTVAIEPGESLSIAEGLAEIVFGCGVRLILEGPAELEVQSPTACRLLSGRAVARAPVDVKEFTVSIPWAEAIALGAEMGLRVARGESAEVHVLRGEVDLEPKAEGEEEGSARRESLRLKAGDARRIRGRVLEAIVAEPEAFVRSERMAEKTRRARIRDDFSSNRLDPRAWKVVLPSHDSALSVEHGRVSLTNRPYLVAADELDPLSTGGVRVTGKWRFAPDPEAKENARIDILSIMTRAEARVGKVYYETASGIEFRLLSSEMAPRIRALGPDLEVTRAEVRGELRAEPNDLLEFEAIDDGRDLRFTIRREGDPSNSVTARATVLRDSAAGRCVIIHNRENPGFQHHVSYLEDVAVETGVGPCP